MLIFVLSFSQTFVERHFSNGCVDFKYLLNVRIVMATFV